MGEKFLIYYDVIVILGFTLLIFVLVFGGVRMRRRAAKRKASWLRGYETIVAFGMFFGAVLLIGSLCLVLLAIVSN